MMKVDFAPEALSVLVERLASAVAAKLLAELQSKQGPQIPPDRLALSPPEAAAALGISERLLWDLTKAGKVRAKKCGSRTLYAITELKRYLGE